MLSLMLYMCVSVSVWPFGVASPVTRGWAWECVECRVTSMVTFPEPRVPGQQLRMTRPREEEGASSKRGRDVGRWRQEETSWSAPCWNTGSAPRPTSDLHG